MLRTAKQHSHRPLSAMATGTDQGPFVNGDINGFQEHGQGMSELKFLIIGAGSRGNAYASALKECRSHLPNRIVAIAEPIASKREALARKCVDGDGAIQFFDTWQQFFEDETARQEKSGSHQPSSCGIDGVFVCTLDETHVEIITALAPLGLHIMSEKPLATTLDDCLKIYRCLQPPGSNTPSKVFSIGHVLRYSPHNMLLRKLLLEDDVIGDVLSIEHTEPVGWWHFAHSYVR